MSDIKQILKDNNFTFNKQFGQNFITDTNLLKAMVSDSGITSEDTVIEIGAGAGTLTRQLGMVAKRVFAFEIDRNLVPILGQTLQGMDDKIQVIMRDIMKVTDEEISQLIDNKPYKVVANLPYYITTPIIMRFLESANKPLSITVMIQKEVAQRLISTADCGDYGVITLSIALEGKTRITRFVPRTMFTPQPNVDSAIINITLDDTYNHVNKVQVKQLFKCAFSMRRKTLVNNLMSGLAIERQRAELALQQMNLDSRVRGETLTLDQYIILNDILQNSKK